MITNKVLKSADVDTLGFDATVDGFTVSVSEGTFANYTPEGGEHSTPEVSFEVVPDDEFPVVYDLYIVEGENPLHLERTELFDYQIPMYTGTDKLVHCILTLQVPPNAQDLADVEIVVNKVVKEVEDTTSQEQPSQ